MATNYPAAVDSFDTKTDWTGDPDLAPASAVVAAADVNDLQDAVASVQSTLGTNPAGSFPTVAARLANAETTIGPVQVSGTAAAGLVLKANSATTATWQVDSTSGGGGGTTGFLEQHYVDVKDFGAKGDYVVATGAGTDDTAAIQAAINSTAIGAENAGKIVLLTPGRYKTTSALVLGQGMHLAAVNPVLGGTVGSQGMVAGSAVIDFFGSATANCVEAIGSTGGISRLQVTNLFIVDRRTSPTGGSGIYFSRVVNHTEIKGCQIHWTDGVGSAIYVGAPSGSVSDCVIIDDCWVFGGIYAVHTQRIDNFLTIRNIKCDTPNGALQQAVIVTGGLNVTHVQDIKHENSNAATVTVLAAGDGQPWTQIIDGVISRLGTGGAVVQISGGSGAGIFVRGLARQNSGTLISFVGNTIGLTAKSGTRLGYWMGGPESFMVNNTAISGNATNSTTSDQMRLTGRVFVSSSTTNAPTTIGTMNVIPSDAATRGLVVQGNTSQTALTFGVHDSAGAGLLTAGPGGVMAGAAGGNLGFYGSAGGLKPQINGSRANAESALKNLIAALAGLGLVIDATTT